MQDRLPRQNAHPVKIFSASECQVVAQEAWGQGRRDLRPQHSGQALGQVIQTRAVEGAPMGHLASGVGGPQVRQGRGIGAWIEAGKGDPGLGISGQQMAGGPACLEKGGEAGGPAEYAGIAEGPDGGGNLSLHPKAARQGIAADQPGIALPGQHGGFRGVCHKGIDGAGPQLAGKAGQGAKGAGSEVKVQAAGRKGGGPHHDPGGVASVMADADPPVHQIGDGGDLAVAGDHHGGGRQARGHTGHVCATRPLARGPQPVRHDDVHIALEEGAARLFLATKGAGDKLEAMLAVQARRRHGCQQGAFIAGHHLGHPDGFLRLCRATHSRQGNNGRQRHCGQTGGEAVAPGGMTG
jgi:hypothetical protein